MDKDADKDNQLEDMTIGSRKSRINETKRLQNHQTKCDIIKSSWKTNRNSLKNYKNAKTFRFYFQFSKYSCVQKFSNKHNFDHNFFVLQSFGLKFSGNLYTYYDYMFAIFMGFHLVFGPQTMVKLIITCSKCKV
jgi:hypothetical protein